MTPSEVEILNSFEGYPFVYDRIDVELTAHFKDKDDEKVAGQVYVMNDRSKFAEVSEAYLEACSKTRFTHYRLRGDPRDEISISIVKGSTGEEHKVHQAKVQEGWLPDFL